MKFSVRTSLVIASAGVCCLCAGGILLAADPTQLSTNLQSAVQHIEKVVFATPNGNGGWVASGQVSMSEEDGKLKIEGGLITNKTGSQNNQAIDSNSSWVSILGGKENKMPAKINESTIIGGENNTISASQSLIAGGKNNAISVSGEYSTILGGIGNKITGNASTILGGQSNTISGNYSTVLGSNNSATGNYSVAAGKNTQVQANSTFAWNDGTNDFKVTQPNFFAIQAASGIVVGNNTPHKVAKLTINGTNGDLRIQANPAKDTTTCNATTLGVIKSVPSSVNGKVCPCFCNGSTWNTMIDSPSCTTVCKDPAADATKTPKCPTSTSAVYKTCAQGTPLEETIDNLVNGKSRQHWTCANLDSGETVDCFADYVCIGTKPTHSQLCSNDDRNLIADTPITTTAACKRYTNCEYVCDMGYSPSSN
ncbi:MAG: hypothetical protein LBH96_00595 [Candidatus Peribacteria bacterium]|jgi:hypothetical protein|nr:hypothetical protein [Candidatus Peribacteria bacterium]